MIEAAHIAEVLDRVRKDRPLVHCISNLVTLEPVANCLLAVGASPIMAHSPDEVAEISVLANALVLNIGTLSKSRANALLIAGKAALSADVPIVLDPVGVGATALRRQCARDILALNPQIVRANASEVRALVGLAGTAKGVDSLDAAADTQSIAEALAWQQGLTVAMTGEIDFITDGGTGTALANGDPMLGRLTGMGCSLSGLTGACLAAADQPTEGATAAVAIMGIAGEMAAERAGGPGSFQAALLDALYHMKAQDIVNRFRVAL